MEQKLPVRSQVPEELTWRLEDIYEDTAAWEADLRKGLALADELAAYEGHFVRDAETMKKGMDLYAACMETLYSFSTYDSHSELCGALRLSRGIRRPSHGYFLRAESFYNVATKEEEYSRGPGGKPQHFHERSHGESFLALAQNSFRGGGLYLLDEPEAALSPQRQLTLMLEIHRCVQEKAQFLIVTHSPILLGLPGAEILSFDDGPVHPCSYEETDSYQVTSMFINHREQVLKRLL